MAGQLSEDTTIRRSEAMLASDLDGEMVMMDLDRGLYFGLDTIGTVIWGLTEQPISVAQVCDQLLDRYEVSREECEREVIRFVGELLENNIVETV